MKKFFALALCFLAAFTFLFSNANLFAANTNDPAVQMWKKLYGPTHDERMQW